MKSSPLPSVFFCYNFVFAFTSWIRYMAQKQRGRDGVHRSGPHNVKQCFGPQWLLLNLIDSRISTSRCNAVVLSHKQPSRKTMVIALINFQHPLIFSTILFCSKSISNENIETIPGTGNRNAIPRTVPD